ncbi:MAG: hypothetical protein ACMXX5_02310 [Candidatus Woesearchaeota archaeon]
MDKKQKTKSKSSEKRADKSIKKPVEDVEEKKQDLQSSISLKEVIILSLGIIIIFSAIIIIPGMRNQTQETPRTLNEMHIQNYKNPPTDTSFIYNGISFIRLPDPRTNVMFWYWQYQENNIIYDIPMRLSPKDVEYVPWTVTKSMPNKSFKGVYITIEPEEEDVNRAYLTLAVSELTEKLSKVRSYPLIAACTENKTIACINRPIITCESSDEHLIIYFKENTDPEIVVHGNCITVKGTNETIVHSSHFLIYRMLGVI